MFFRKRFSLKNTEEAKKDQKRKLNFSTFCEKEKEKKKILTERTKRCFVRV